MRLYDLIFEPDREGHIARHGVTVQEVEEVAFGAPFVRRTRQRRLRLIGQTRTGRYLTIILAARGRTAYGLVTARDATIAERRLYLRWKRR